MHRTLWSAVCFAATCLVPSVCLAERATLDEMTRVAENWLKCVAVKEGAWNASTHPKVIGYSDIVQSDTLVGRCFHVSPSGYVVVPVLKELQPVRAFSTGAPLECTGRSRLFSLVTELLAEQARLFVHLYGDLDVVAATVKPMADDARPDFWAILLEGGGRLEELTCDSSATVDPMIPVLWSQWAPFNARCPVGCGGDRCAVGCVAVAAGQVMRYHEWPPAGALMQEASYDWDGDGQAGCGAGTLSADSRDRYNWELMPTDPIQPDEADAVAELLYEIGVAVEMDYGTEHSTASAGDLDEALSIRFRYLEPEWAYRGYYGNEEWFDLIREEMDAARPVIYKTEHHVFNVDGYDICDPWYRKIHINYGWGDGAEETGWFTLDAIPNGGSSFDHYLLHHIIPDRSDLVTVQPDGSGDYATIQAAIDGAVAGDLIELGPGTFRGYGNRDLCNDLTESSVVIYSRGGDPGTCVIDCDGSPSEPHRGFNLNWPAGRDLIVDGITICGGDGSSGWLGSAVLCSYAGASFDHCVIQGNSGADGALHIRQGSTPRFRNCIIRNNACRGVTCVSSDAEFVECSFRDNAVTGDGGGAYCGGDVEHVDSTPIFEECEFVDNTASSMGGGAAVCMSAPVFRDCLFGGNQAPGGGGAICLVNGDPEFDGCRFIGNVASSMGGGVGVCGSPGVRYACEIRGSVFHENVALRGGAIAFWNEVEPLLENCSLGWNSAQDGGAGFYCYNYASPVLRKCIVAHNLQCAALVNNSSGECHPVLECCDIYGNAGGDWYGGIESQSGVEGNFEENPQFCGEIEWVKDWYSLSGESPCAEENNPTCGRVGAYGIGCETSGIAEWGVGREVYVEVSPNPSDGDVSLEVPSSGGGRGGKVDAEVVDVTGRLVRVLAGDVADGGRMELRWDGRDKEGAEVAGGVYFVRVETEGVRRSVRLVVLR